MEAFKGKGQFLVSVKAITWYKDSHSLFDFQSTKTATNNYNFSLNTKFVTFYRKRQSQIIVVKENDDTRLNNQEYQFLTKFEIQSMNESNSSKARLHFSSKKKATQKDIQSDRLKTNESVESDSSREQQTYIIVRKIKDINGEPKGYKLQPSQTIKLGRVQFYVSQVFVNGVLNIAASSKNRQKVYASRKVMKFDPSLDNNKEKNQCKICLQQAEIDKDYLFNPCKCSGSCGTVHMKCLMEWIHFKVKKQVVGGTLHYNFEKFECEVCKSQLPMIIDINNEMIEMLPIQKPQGNYMILEGQCERSKSVMIIQNVAAEGIKLGRGHECEIRITDISVSRNHALIKNINGHFYIFDNKSKFGTLVREDNMSLEVGRQPHGVQIGRTVLTMEIKKEKDIKQGKQ